VTVTLSIESPWHLYANPVGVDDLKSGQTAITVSGASKPEVVSIEYPKGKKIKDAIVGDYSIYESEVAIKVTIKRPKDAKGNVEFAVRLQACNDKSCLPPSTVKSTIE
jgi:DsbC/DsbD-like thiol-disulfide interchange protein